MDACEFPRLNSSSTEISSLLARSKIIAVVGLSPKPDRPSHGVAQYLQDAGYRIIPVNPGHSTILGERCYSKLAEVPESIDIVNVFRPAEAIPAIVDEAIAKKAKAVWLQLGIVNNEAAEKAKKAGLIVVQNKCISVEHREASFPRKPARHEDGFK